MWVSREKSEWVHYFVHTLDEMLRQWYVSVDLRREITTWEELSIFFSHTFRFANAGFVIHSVLKHIYNMVLNVSPVVYHVDLHEAPRMQLMVE